jgi:hypothetical protein
MHTSRVSLNRLFDATDTSLTLTTLSSAASPIPPSCQLWLWNTSITSPLILKEAEWFTE